MKTSSDGHLYFCVGHYDLDVAPPYRCLSYVWGSGERLRTINVEGSAFTIRENLFEFLALHHERLPDGYIWIDQLCVDQTNNSERNHQVQLMAEIYSAAEEGVGLA
jgi:hypothetical protein